MNQYEVKHPADDIFDESVDELREMDNLTRDVLAAERAGMSYGKWKAFHPHTKKDWEEED